MKNKHLSKAIAEQNFYKFITYMKYKAEFNLIEFIQVPRFYQSSKTCSDCRATKKDLSLPRVICTKVDKLIYRNRIL
ncbi:zinc ribbon domain-containing protein [Cetobacterium sp.]|uniref:zinc ribbon domain-containing protein n=1 Tax=Cetobacterium sp. TaxID=2071632 RepID=UPI003F2EF4D6